jgi:hypothetical protein
MQNAKPEFRDLGEEAVMAALEDPDSQNPVAVEVGRLVSIYAVELRKQKPMVLEAETQPLETRFAIETIALRLAAKLTGVPMIKPEGDAAKHHRTH